MKAIKYWLPVVLLAPLGGIHAQDIHFSQYNYAPMLLNPALVGAEHVIQFNMNYREQWRAVDKPYKTLGASYDMRIHKSESGHFAGGLFFYNDKAGQANLTTNVGGLSLGYHLRINEKQTIGLGIQGSFTQMAVQTNSLTWGNQYDGTQYNSSLASGEVYAGDLTHSYGDVAAGAVWTYSEGERYMTGNDKRGATVGFSVYHPANPNYSFYGNQNILHTRYILHGNFLFGISNSRWTLLPTFFYSLQGGARELTIGNWFRFRLVEESHFTGIIKGSALSAGFWYRNKDACVAGAMLEFSGYALGVTYDINISSLKAASNGRGGAEISLRYYYPSSRASMKLRRLL